MYRQITIKDFRGIHELSLTGLRGINLFVGRNNSGKTTVLEGVFLLGGATNPFFPTTLGQLRCQRFGASYPDPLWRPLFYRLEPRANIEISGQREDEPRPRRLIIEALRVTNFADEAEYDGVGTGIASVTEDFVIGGLRLRYQPARGPEIRTQAVFDPHSGSIDAKSEEREDFLRTTFLSARAYSSLARDAQQYSFLLRIKQEQDVLDAVKIIEPTIERIEVLSEPGGPSVYVDVGLESLIPLAACGEGFVRLFSIVVELTASRHGTLLIDEIDNGLHHSILPNVWRLLGALSARHGVQIFATTHNEELLFSALEAFAERPDQIGLFRIDRRDGQHSVAAYDAEMQEAVREHHFEVRG